VKRASVVGDDFHPDLRTIARFLPRHLVSPSTLQPLRAVTALQGVPPRRDVEVATLPSGAGVRLHRPAEQATPGPGLLWIHGGGYVLGRAKQDDNLCRRFAGTLGATVAAVDYRLAPEHPFPAGLEDCYAALTWLAGQPAVDPDRVAIAGASAGGGLAAALALHARDVGSAVRPVLQLLVYPMLDDRTLTRTDLDGTRYRLWSEDSNRFGWTSYLAGGDPRIAVPARHADLAGLPPAWVGVGTRDMFHDEDLVYADRLKAAGVPCHVEIVPGAFHSFDVIRPKAGVSQAFFASQCTSLREAFAI
jgi:acetyl esterase/lipase